MLSAMQHSSASSQYPCHCPYFLLVHCITDLYRWYQHCRGQLQRMCRVPVTVTTIYRDDNEVQAAKGGENLRLRLGGIDDDDLSPGFVLCSRHLPVPAVTYFDAQLHLLDLLEHKSLFSAGYKAILHVHAAVEECEITALLAQIDPKTKEKKRVRASVVSQ